MKFRAISSVEERAPVHRQARSGVQLPHGARHMPETLQQLIGEAKALAGDNVCAVLGHDWKSIGGRKCPRHPDGSGLASQTVYICVRCPAEDYGDKGGPGYRDCYERGPCDMSCVPTD